MYSSKKCLSFVPFIMVVNYVNHVHLSRDGRSLYAIDRYLNSNQASTISMAQNASHLSRVVL